MLEPSPANSILNGISVPFRLTVAFQSPAMDSAQTAGANAMTVASNSVFFICFLLRFVVRIVQGGVPGNWSISARAHHVGVHLGNRQIIVPRRQPPAFLLLLMEGRLIGEQLLTDAASRRLRLPALVIDKDAQVPAAFLAESVGAATLYDVPGDEPFFLLFVQNGNLILLEERVPFVKVAPPRRIDPLHDVRSVRLSLRSGLRICPPAAGRKGHDAGYQQPAHPAVRDCR